MMKAVGRAVQVASAGLGFFVGYFWAVSRWAGGDSGIAQELLRSAATAGAAVSVLYALLLAGLFWARIPAPKLRGLRIVISPAAFSLSCVLGAVGMQGALWLLRYP